jgi:hydroxymethylglutaryl-CoA lyase
MNAIKIVECPRDAWQGLPNVIPTEAKIAYLRKLLECGFHHLDAVSFVSPKYVPQMADSEQVMEALYPDLAEPLEGIGFARPGGAMLSTHPQSQNEQLWTDAGQSTIDNRQSSISESRPPRPEIVGIVVNEAGLERALKTPGLTTIGYPYSVSAHFRRANANMSKAESQALVHRLQRAVSAPDAPVRNLVVYISMAFGNNYDEPWGPEIVIEAVEWLREIGVTQISLADTIGTATPDDVSSLYKSVTHALSSSNPDDSASTPRAASNAEFELGLHLHSRPEEAADKVLAAYEAGCRRFDSALTALGGCPFAGDDLVGNVPTEIVVSTLSAQGAETGIEPWALLAAVKATKELRKQFAP